MTAETNRLVKVSLDDSSMAAASRDAEHERAVAIYDLIEENSFAPLGDDGGPIASPFRWSRTASYSTSVPRAASR